MSAHDTQAAPCPLPPVTAARAQDIASRFTAAHVLVIGDAMLDKFIVGRVTRISPEAPVPVVAFAHETDRIGGAANVAHNIAALGGRATLIATTGQDAAAATLAQACRSAGIAPFLVGDAGRPTTTKTRIVTDRNQQVARIDYEDDLEISGAVEARVIAAVQQHASRASAVVVSDYLKGCVTRNVIDAAVHAAASAGVPVLVDPKVPHIDYYARTTVVTPNHHEAEAATHIRVRSHEEARTAARRFRERVACESVLMTRGDQGMWLLTDDVEGYLPAAAREVADVTGAGDTVIATIAMALAAGATLVEAVTIANGAAGIVVGKFGPAVLSVDELLGGFSGNPESQSPRPEAQG
jgi:D-beta-D-heptose 7-phosphate kinase/D-beta-D-heptose 1-phosphate adenosyltransferase